MTLTAVVNARTYDWSTWLLGIFRSFISGGSAAMVSGLTSIGIAPDKFNLSNSVGNTLKLMGVMFLFQGGYRMFEFLQLHGAPDKLQQTLQVAADATAKAGGAIAEAQAQVPIPPKGE
jgi:hypothetical protein